MELGEGEGRRNDMKRSDMKSYEVVKYVGGVGVVSVFCVNFVLSVIFF